MRKCYGEKYYQEDRELLRATLKRAKEVMDNAEYKKQIGNLIELNERNDFKDELSLDLIIKCFEIQAVCDKIEQRKKNKQDYDEFFDSIEKFRKSRSYDDFEI